MSDLVIAGDGHVQNPTRAIEVRHGQVDRPISRRHNRVGQRKCRSRMRPASAPEARHEIALRREGSCCGGPLCVPVVAKPGHFEVLEEAVGTAGPQSGGEPSE